MNDIDLLRAASDYSWSAIIIGSNLRSADGQVQDFRVLFANHQAGQVAGQPVDELTGSSLRASFPALKEGVIWQQVIEVARTGVPVETESQFALPSGAVRFFAVSLHQYDDGIIMVLSDISDAKQTEQGLRRKIDELLRSNANLEQFAYVASHDLQEPLRKLIGFGDMLQNQYRDVLGAQGTALLDRMRLATGRMQALIKNLLNFSRLTSVKAAFKPVNLQAIVDTVLSDLDAIIREKKAVLDVTSLPYVTGDGGQLGQLFQNLLSNALKFTRPNDIPLIRIDCELIKGSAIVPMPGMTVLITDLNRSFFAVTVSDNGIGFDEKYLDRIFTIFQRLNNPSDYPGTGIGLAVVHRIIENHRGYLSVRSQPGRGADFTVYLPGEPVPTPLQGVPTV